MEKPQVTPPEGSLRAEVASGDRKRALVALRDEIAGKIDSDTADMCAKCGGPRGEAAGLASLAKELRAIIDEIEAIPNPAEVTFLDRVREQHNSRLPDAEQASTARKSQSRKSGSRRPGAGRRAGSGPVAGIPDSGNSG